MDKEIKNIRFCEVVSVDDTTGAGRIKVRLTPEDNRQSNDSLPYAIPLLPKMFYIQPKVGEGVFLFLGKSNKGESQRYYIGPIVSQLDFMYFNKLLFGADSIFPDGPVDFIRSKDTVPEIKGVFPDNTDVAVLGRKNCDIHIKEDDIRIRAGVKLVDDVNKYKTTFNRNNPSYLKMKYHPKPLGGDIRSTATIVADEINLISNKGNPHFNTTDMEHLITDEELDKVLNDAYRLPYGEKLLEFLKKFIDIFNKHTHNFATFSPNKAYIDELNQAAEGPITNEELLSNTVRFN